MPDIPYQYVSPTASSELRKDGFGCPSVSPPSLLRAYGRPQQSRHDVSATFDIRDGPRWSGPGRRHPRRQFDRQLCRVRPADDRKPLMRSSLTAIEAELTPRLRTTVLAGQRRRVELCGLKVRRLRCRPRRRGGPARAASQRSPGCGRDSESDPPLGRRAQRDGGGNGRVVVLSVAVVTAPQEGASKAVIPN